jgi:hypothetical protein
VPKLTAAQQAMYAERRMKALRASVSGLLYPEIVRLSQEEGWEPDPYNSRQSVASDIKKALAERQKERNAQADVWVQVKLEELEALKAAAWKVLRAKHYVVNQGVIVYMGVSADEETRRGWNSVDALRQELIYNEDGSWKEPLEDDKPVLDAIDRILKIQDQELKITGHYAPVKKQVEVSGGLEVDLEIEQLMEVLASGRKGTLAPSTAQGERQPVLRHPGSISRAHRTAHDPDSGT